MNPITIRSVIGEYLGLKSSLQFFLDFFQRLPAYAITGSEIALFALREVLLSVFD
jgi:hypothetical protein